MQKPKPLSALLETLLLVLAFPYLSCHTHGVLITGDDFNFYPHPPSNDPLLLDAYKKLIYSQCTLTNGGTAVLIRKDLILTQLHIGVDVANHEKVQFADGALSAVQSPVATNRVLVIYKIAPAMPKKRVVQLYRTPMSVGQSNLCFVFGSSPASTGSNVMNVIDGKTYRVARVVLGAGPMLRWGAVYNSVENAMLVSRPVPQYYNPPHWLCLAAFYAGDSGGGHFIQHPNGTWQLIGLTSTASEYDTFSLRQPFEWLNGYVWDLAGIYTYPGIYHDPKVHMGDGGATATPVFDYLPWLDSIIKGP
jgi:hypothetical protein